MSIQEATYVGGKYYVNTGSYMTNLQLPLSLQESCSTWHLHILIGSCSSYCVKLVPAVEGLAVPLFFFCSMVSLETEWTQQTHCHLPSKCYCNRYYRQRHLNVKEENTHMPRYHWACYHWTGYRGVAVQETNLVLLRTWLKKRKQTKFNGWSHACTPVIWNQIHVPWWNGKYT